MGHALNGAIQDALDQARQDEGLRGAVAPRGRPRLHSRPERRRAQDPARRGQVQVGPGPRGLRRALQGVRACRRGRRSSASTSASAPPSTGVVCSYTMDDDYVDAVLTAFIELHKAGPDLPRQPHHQLVPARPLRHLRPRGQLRGRGRQALRSALPVRRRQGSGPRWRRTSSRSSRPVPRPCSATSRWSSTRTTVDTGTSSAGASRCRSWGGRSRSSPTSTWIPPSAPAS